MKKKKKNYRSRLKEHRHSVFADHFMELGKPTFQNAYLSAIEAGYSTTWSKAKSYTLLASPTVKQALDKIRKRRLELDICTPEEVLTRLTGIIRGNPKRLADETGSLLRIHAVDDLAAENLVAGVKEKTRTIGGGGDSDPITEQTYEYKLLDRLKAIQLMAQHHGLIGREEKPTPPNYSQTNILVGYPTEPMPLEEWERQVRALIDKQEKERLAITQGA